MLRLCRTVGVCGVCVAGVADVCPPSSAPQSQPAQANLDVQLRSSLSPENVTDGVQPPAAGFTLGRFQVGSQSQPGPSQIEASASNRVVPMATGLLTIDIQCLCFGKLTIRILKIMSGVFGIDIFVQDFLVVQCREMMPDGGF